MNAVQFFRFFWLLALTLALNTPAAFALHPDNTCANSMTSLHLLGQIDTSDDEYDKVQNDRSEKVGLALSGGGSRALVLFEALSRLMQPPYRKHISRVSASSGGAWAITSTFMQTSDKFETFLGSPGINLEQLYWDDTEKEPGTTNIAKISPERLASVAQRLDYNSAFYSFFWPLKFKIPPFPGYSGWSHYLSQALLKPFDLNASSKFTHSSFPSLKNRTELIINAYLEGRNDEKIPFEMTPETVGGAKTAFKEGAFTFPPCGFNREVLPQELKCLNGYCSIKLGEGKGLNVADAMATTGANYIDTFPFYIKLKGLFSYHLFAPRFAYPEIDEQHKTVKSSIRIFADSGNEDFVSIMPLLRRGQKKIIAFVHTGIPLKRGHSGIIGMEKVMPSYFGIVPDESAEKTNYEEDIRQSQDCRILSSRNKVFASHHYQLLAEGLWNKKEIGEAIVYKQENLTVLENNCYGIPGGTSVDIVWIYNDVPKGWLDRLQPALKSKIESNESFKLFPHYGFKELHLSPPVANMMSALAKWTIENSEDQWGTFFRTK